MRLSTEERAILEQRLEEAEAKRHALLTGDGLASVRDASGRQLQRHAPEVQALDRYIAELKRKLGLASGYRALGVRF